MIWRSRSIYQNEELGPHARALLKAMGYTQRELTRPFIGLANAWSTICPGHQRLRELAIAVGEGIREAGGTPFEFGTIGVCDGLTQGHDGMRYVLPTRDLIASDIEMMIQAHCLDGVVLLGSCDKIVPGMLMAAARLDLPCIMVNGGPMHPGEFRGLKVAGYKVMEVGPGGQAGRMTEEEAVALGIKAIRHATFRDAFSGGFIIVYLITRRDGWKRVFREDVAATSTQALPVEADAAAGTI